MLKILTLTALTLMGCAHEKHSATPYNDKAYLNEEIFTLEQIKHANFGTEIAFDDQGLCTDQICTTIAPGRPVMLNSKGHIFLDHYTIKGDITFLPATGPHNRFVFGYYLQSNDAKIWFVHKTPGQPTLVCNEHKECDLR